jgi:hypothetical protein
MERSRSDWHRDEDARRRERFRPRDEERRPAERYAPHGERVGGTFRRYDEPDDDRSPAGSRYAPRPERVGGTFRRYDEARDSGFGRARDEERDVDRGSYGAFGRDPDEDPRRWQGWAPGAWTYTELWLIEGPHTGRGPKGFRHADDRLREQVGERLERHGEIDASDIEISVDDGVVTLEGSVADRRAKRLAEDCAESVYGVRDVMNRLRVDRGFFERLFGGSDEESKEEASGGREQESGRKA